MALALTNLDLASVPPGVDLAAAGANVCGATDLDASFAALLFGLQTFPDRADLLGTATDDDTLARPAAPPRRRPDDETSPEADAASLQPQFALAAAVPTVVVTAAPRPVAVPVATPEETARQSVASPNTDPATDSTRPPTWATRMGADLGAIPASFPPPTETENPLRAVPTATPIPEARPLRASPPGRGVSAQPTGPHEPVTGPRQACDLAPHDSTEVVGRLLVAAATGDAQHSTVAARTEGDLDTNPTPVALPIPTPVTVEVVQTHPAVPSSVTTTAAGSTPGLDSPAPVREILSATRTRVSTVATTSTDAHPALPVAPLRTADTAPTALVDVPTALAAVGTAPPDAAAAPRPRRGFLLAQPTETVRTEVTAPASATPTITPDFAPPAVVSPVPLEPRRDRDEAPTERELELPLAAVLTGPTPTEAAPQAALGDAHRVAATAAVPSRETDEPEPVTHLRLRLAPPLLGEVLLDVRHDGGAVTAHAIVSLPATEHVLRQVQTQVQQLLADQGLQAGAFDLTCAYSSTGGGGGGSHLPQPFGVRSGAWAARPEVPDVTPSEAPQGPPPGWSRIVDIIA